MHPPLEPIRRPLETPRSRPRSRRTALFGLVLVFVLLGCRFAQQQLPGVIPSGAEVGPGLIAYAGTDGAIYTIDREGGNRQQVSPAQQGDNQDQSELVCQQPTWSPAEARLAFVCLGHGEDGFQTGWLYASRADGGELNELFSSVTDFPFYLYWAPDGERVSYLTSGDKDLLHLYIAPTGEGRARLVSIGQPYYWMWSPDGETILIHTGGAKRSNPEARIALLTPGEETGEQEFTLLPGFFQAPAWSPDGSAFLVVGQDENGEAGLLLADAQGAVQSSLTASQGMSAFGWSPGGDNVAFLTPDSPDSPSLLRRLTVLEPGEPGAPIHVPEYPVVAFFWAPDGRQLAYFVPLLKTPEDDQASLRQPQQDNELKLTLYVLDVDSGLSHQVTTFTASGGFSSMLLFFDQYQHSATLWSPDSQQLALSAKDAAGNPGVYVISASGVGGLRQIAEGDTAVWSFR